MSNSPDESWCFPQPASLTSKQNGWTNNKKHPNLQEPQSELAISTAWSQPVYSSMHGSNPVQGTSNKNGNVDQKKKKAPNFASL